MASGYRYDDARPTGGTYGSSRDMNSDATPYGRTRLSEGNGYYARDERRDMDARYRADQRDDYPREQSYPDRSYRDEPADQHYEDPHYSDRGYRDEHQSDAAHRDSEHEAAHYGDARYRDDYNGAAPYRQEARYDDRDDRRRGGSGGYNSSDDERGYGFKGDHDDRGGYDDRDAGYHRGVDDRNAGYDSSDSGPDSGQETRRVSPEELGLPSLTRRGGPKPPVDPDDRTTVDVPVRRRDSRPKPPEADAESTVLLPRQTRRPEDSDEARTQYVPRGAAAGAVGATRGLGGQADNASTQMIRRPEELPRIDIPGASDDQSTQLFTRPDDLGPVFVDSSGKRAKSMKILVRVFGVLCLIFLAGIVLSLTTSPSTAMHNIINPQDSASPTPAKTSSTPKPKVTPSAAVAPAATARASHKSVAPSVKPTKKPGTPTPTPTNDGDNGGLPTTIPTLGPTTGAPTTEADPTVDATPTNRRNNN